LVGTQRLNDCADIGEVMARKTQLYGAVHALVVCNTFMKTGQ